MEGAGEGIISGERGDRLNSLIAVTVALLSAFMAVTKVKDDNIVQAMLQAKTDAVDTWSDYQSKRIKQHLCEVGTVQAKALRLAVSAQGAAELDNQIRQYESDITRYKAEEDELQAKAKGFEAQYDALNFKDDQFDLSDASLSISIGMLAVTALTGKRKLLWLSWFFAFFGVLMGMSGLLGLGIHPNWLTKLLS